MPGKYLLVILLFATLVTGCVNSGNRRLGSIVSQVELPADGPQVKS